MRLAIVGTGYVGLVTGTCFAESGNTVACIDIDQAKIENLKQGIIPIYEAGLESLVIKNLEQKRITFTTNLEEGVRDAEVIFVCLPTPQNGDESADLRFILSLADELGPLLLDYAVIVDKSTAPVGTSEQVRARIAAGTDTDFDVVVNPEFLREGMAVEDFMKPDRVVVGTRSERAQKIMERLYVPFLRSGNQLICMDERSAELTKYAANSFLATKISFMNEIANLSELFGCNVDSIRHGIGSDPRIGKRFLFPGIGYGGSCFPKDVKAMVQSAKAVNYDFKILKAVMSVNEEQRLKLIHTVKSYFNGSLEGKVLAIWGLSFKPNTDDVREAPALYIIEEFLDAQAVLQVYDPEAIPNARKILNDRVQYFESAYDAAATADALIIMTEWPEFQTPDFEKLSASLKQKVIFDGRNLYDLNLMRDLGYTYCSIGREPVNLLVEPIELNLEMELDELKKVG
jgi:UDPglucose 6-dehydrogenase